jgi:hypothetical protein
MKLTRHVRNIGVPEQITFNSNELPPTNKSQSGGYYVKPVFTDDIPMGPNGGILGHEIGKNCGINSDLNMDASKQHGGKRKRTRRSKRKRKRKTSRKQRGGMSGYGRLSEGTSRYGVDLNQNLSDFKGSYAPIKGSSVQSCNMSGGMKTTNDICKNLSKIKSLKNVERFWKKNCAETLNFYKNKLTNHKHNVFFLKKYTKAICHFTNAITSKKTYMFKKQYNLMNNVFKEIENKLDSNHISHHKKIVDNKNKILMKIYNDRIKLTKLSNIHKNKRKTIKHKHKHKRKSVRKSTNKNKRKSNRKKKYNKKRRTLKRYKHKGGYHQFNSNVPISSTYTVVPSGSSNLNAPPMIQKINNCHDNYNHYTGKNHVI